MAFQQEPVKTPTSIGRIHVTLSDPDGVNSNRSIFGVAKILDQSGEEMDEWRGDLQPHLTAAQITSLVNFLNALRTQAVDQLLP